MVDTALGTLLRHIRQLAGPPEGPTDRQLLDRFAAGRDEGAFAALVGRHGPMVLRVCRRVLGDAHDAEDAFQATFLVLARSAGAVRRSEALASWLHGVARRTALAARRRRAHEQRGTAAPPGDPAWQAAWREVQAVLDDEVGRLPAKYRAPFVLCFLEGKSRPEAARELGWKEGTVSSRLARARDRLRLRLARRGVCLSSVLAGLGLAPDADAGGLCQTLIHTTTQAALRANVPARAAALARGVIRAMFLTRMKTAAGLVLAVSVALAGSGRWARQAVPAQEPEPTRPGPAAAGEPAKGAPDRAARDDTAGDPLPAGALARLGTLRFRAGGPVWGLGLLPDGKTLVVEEAGGVCWWDARTGKELRRWNASLGPNGSLALTRDGVRMACASARDDTFVSWDVAAGRQLRRFEGHQGPVRGLAVSPDGRLVASAGEDRTVRLWQLVGGDELPLTTTPPVDPAARGLVRMKELRRLEGHAGAVLAVAFAPDGKALASGGADKLIRLWDPATGAKRATLEGHGDQVVSVAFAPDGTLLASAGGDETVRLWDLAGKKERHRFKIRSRPEQALVPDGLLSGVPVAFAPGGGSLAVGGWDGTIYRWETGTGAGQEPLRGHHAAVTGLAFAADGRTLFSAGLDHTVRRCASVISARRNENRPPGTGPGGRFQAAGRAVSCHRPSNRSISSPLGGLCAMPRATLPSLPTRT
jgi:RNA polymerase sigma factor (sigma-70 family)